MQRYEATRYAGDRLERIQAVAEALGVTIREQVVFGTLPDEPGAAADEHAEEHRGTITKGLRFVGRT